MLKFMNFFYLLVEYLLKIFGILNFLLIGLDFESYFIKLVCILANVVSHLSAHLMFVLVPELDVAFAPCTF